MRVESGRGREAMGIGKLSRQSACKVETIRYYERIGLLPEPPRTEGGHRLYADAHLRRLAFIRRSRELGFPIERIRELLGLVDGGDYTCGEVKELAAAHLASVREKIRDLRRLERSLADISSRCEGGKVPECPVIDALYNRRK